MLTPKQQAALNALTDTTLLVEMAEGDIRAVERDTLSRTLPPVAQLLRVKLSGVALRMQERQHERARARVLCLYVPTGRTYRTFDNGGNEYRTFLHQDYTLTLDLHRVAGQVKQEPKDVDTARRRATLEEAGDLLAPHGLTLRHSEEDYSRAVLLGEGERYLGTVFVADHGSVYLITEEGALALTYRIAQDQVLCNAHNVKRARGGDFRPA